MKLVKFADQGDPTGRSQLYTGMELYSCSVSQLVLMPKSYAAGAGRSKYGEVRE